MKMYLKLGLILLAFCVIATGILAYVNSLTSPKIKALKEKQENDTRAKLIPNCTFVEVKGEPSYYIAKDQTTGEIKGYTFMAQKIGYSGPVKTMAAMDKDFKLISIQVLDQSETPGLGANCVKENFSGQFKGKAAGQLVVDKDGGKLPNAIVAMTGATITTRAVTASLREQLGNIRKAVEAASPDPNPATQTTSVEVTP
jgi:electron transport complex protein RnfG